MSDDFILFDGEKWYQPDARHKRLAARIAELEALREQDRRISINIQLLNSELFQEKDARIAELEAQIEEGLDALRVEQYASAVAIIQAQERRIAELEAELAK